jgi:hypothetical protein
MQAQQDFGAVVLQVRDEPLAHAAGRAVIAKSV